MLSEEIENSNQEEKIGTLAGFVWFGQLRQYPDETIMEVLRASNQISVEEIISAINFYISSPFCLGNPAETAQNLCGCLPRA